MRGAMANGEQAMNHAAQPLQLGERAESSMLLQTFAGTYR